MQPPNSEFLILNSELAAKQPLLLHACCAPCACALVEHLLGQGVKFVVFFSNSNIYPREEYDIRRDELLRLARESGLEVVEDDYDHEAWLRAVSGLEREPERGARCMACFRFRLQRAARFAHRSGFPLLATTLASSRWKRLDQVNGAGEEVAAEFEDVRFVARNWRKGGLQERRNQLLRERGFYNQRYCGCEFSVRD